MISASLQGIAELVIRRARRQGFIVPREVREELAHGGLAEGLWKDVLALARPSLRYRHGRYYYCDPVSERVRKKETQRRQVEQAVREIIKQHRAAIDRVERRQQDRVDFIQAVQVITEDQTELTLLSRDLSTTGIRLIGTRRLLGQKVLVRIPRGEGQVPWEFRVQILWTCVAGDGLIENGGSFLDFARS
jgi:hypothetical protein